MTSRSKLPLMQDCPNCRRPAKLCGFVGSRYVRCAGDANHAGCGLSGPKAEFGTGAIARWNRISYRTEALNASVTRP